MWFNMQCTRYFATICALCNLDDTQMTILYIDSGNSAQAKLRTKQVKAGQWLQITQSVYTDDLQTPLPRQTASAIIKIIGFVYPNVMISHRSAYELRPHDNRLYVTGTRSRKHTIQGIEIVEVVGPPFLADYDQQMMGTKVSGIERLLLENLEINRRLDKSLGQPWVEEWLERELGRLGEVRLNEIRDRIKAIADQGHWHKACAKINNIIGSLLGTKNTTLISERAIARSRGEPYDAARIDLFDGLSLYLKRGEFVYRRPQSLDTIALTNTAFWDAYFSNYIEGTRFRVDEAEVLVFDKQINSERHEDSHNMIRSYDLLSNPREMSRIPNNADEFVDLMVQRHRYFMAESLDKKPGEFKKITNRAGNTEFVTPERVEGTLTKAYLNYQLLGCPIRRALYIMFVVAEVHPFVDGNGRIARKMMNAELVAEGLERIIIPTCFREDYLLGLRSLTRHTNFNAYCRMLDRAHHFTASFNYLNLDDTEQRFIALTVFDEDSRLPDLGYRKAMSIMP